MKKKIALFLTLFTFIFIEAKAAHAQAVTSMPVRFGAPRVSDVSTSTAIVGLSKANIDQMDVYDLEHFYFEYFKTNQVCIAIYPTPEYCLPKKTKPGVSSVLLKDLEPNTEYTVVYKRDNSINCITTPCPNNEIRSAEAHFTTLATTASSTEITFSKNLKKGMQGDDVYSLQLYLYEKGFLKTTPTGYFGKLTHKAVKEFQRSLGVPPTGYFGPQTRKATGSVDVGERFSGNVTAVSTACFYDGECSISVDGKKVVTALGWSRETVGSIKGVASIGDVPVNAHAIVYARKTKEGYTLYGNQNYYIEIQFEK